MKPLRILILIVSFTGIIGCSKNDVSENDPDVETYIELVKTNNYNSIKLPEFSSNDIPALIACINDDSPVSKFPYSLISSYAPPRQDYRLGILMLWTIESIRLTACNKNLLFGFPSQHSFIVTKSEPYTWIPNHADQAYEKVKQAYLKWWTENKNKKFSSFCDINPLENTDYRWH